MTENASALRPSDGAADEANADVTAGAGAIGDGAAPAGADAAGLDASLSAAIPDAARLAALADEFARRHRGGERPSPEEYARRHPGLAAEVRELFPAIALMEHPGVAGGRRRRRAGRGDRRPLPADRTDRRGRVRRRVPG